MDLDAFVATHAPRWDRLDRLVRRAGRPRRLSGDDVDELVELYQRAATHLSLVQAQAPDPALVGRLSTLLARARAAVTGSGAPAWQDAVRFLTVTFPATAYRAWRWWLGVSVGTLLVMLAVGLWVGGSANVRAQLLPPAQARALVNRDFADYYSNHPAASFAAHVWTNNAYVAAGTLVLGIAFGLPTLYLLFQTAANTGLIGGYLIAAGHGEQYFGLLLPHGILELTLVFLAAAIGLRLGWTVIDPGHRRRADALAEEGRAAVSAALGLALALAVSGVIEAFVTPSGLPTAARIGIGVLAEAAFLAWVLVLGRRAVRAGETGDLELGRRPDARPTA